MIGFFSDRIEEIRARPTLLLWYGVLAIVALVECQWVPSAVASLGASPMMQGAYTLLGFAAVGAEVICLDLMLRQFRAKNWRGLLVLPLFLAALVVTKEGDVLTYGRERNRQAFSEQVSHEHYSDVASDQRTAREQIAALNASVPGGLLAVQDYSDQIDVLEHRRDDGQWKSRADEDAITQGLLRLKALQGSARRRDALLTQPETSVPAPATVRDPARDWDGYIFLVQPLARLVAPGTTLTPETAGAIFGISLMVFSGLFLTLGAAAVGGVVREARPQAPRPEPAPKDRPSPEPQPRNGRQQRAPAPPTLKVVRETAAPKQSRHRANTGWGRTHRPGMRGK